MKTILIIALVLLTGCANALKNMTAGQTGCMPKDVKILVNPGSGWDMSNQRFYVAECGGIKYACSYALVNGHFSDPSCKELK